MRRLVLRVRFERFLGVVRAAYGQQPSIYRTNERKNACQSLALEF
jgi:hypothetical protein